MNDDLLARFVTAFKRGIEGELKAMREGAAAFEIALSRGEELGGKRYAFDLPAGERLIAGTVCVLKSGIGEQRAVVERVEDTRVTLACDVVIDAAATAALLVAPWFLYERMMQALDGVKTAPLALKLFGKGEPVRTRVETAAPRRELNPSQQAAVQLCLESDVAFVWGPPGTGKTATLAHVVEELVARGVRVLIASTTNAAIDQLLAKLAARSGFEPGVFVRIGRSDAETFGAEIGDIVEKRQAASGNQRLRLRSRVAEIDETVRYARGLAAELVPVLSAQQSLFGDAGSKLRASALARVFGAAAESVAARDARNQLRTLEERIARLERVRVLAKKRLVALATEDRGFEARVVAEARVVLCTLTNVYISPLLSGQRFDALIAEEAGMATLPPLFYAASLCDKRAIMVGDPRQLPPIVQSDDTGVRRAIGRSVFDVTVPQPMTSPIVAMLEVQYRMHPHIGRLVGDLFYGGRLIHEPRAVEPVAARAPFPGRAVVVVDVKGVCERSQKGTSRVNMVSAERTADLAVEAVRAGSESVAVITPYAAQAVEIRRLLAARRVGDVVECSTIHRFQGRECDVVMIDLVDANPMRPSGLLADAPNLLNVSISRARGKLVIVADVAYFDAMDPRGLVATLLRAAQN